MRFFKNDTKVVEKLLAGEYRNSPLINEKGGRNGSSALHLAAFNGNVEVINLLLNAGAFVDQLNNDGMTPLHMVANNGNAILFNTHGLLNGEAFQVLLDAGAKVNSIDKYGCSALHLAAGNGNVEAVKVLLNAGADENLKTKHGESPFDCAKQKINHTVIDDLLHHIPLALKQKQIIDLETRLKALEAENEALTKNLEEEKTGRITDEIQAERQIQQLQYQHQEVELQRLQEKEEDIRLAETRLVNPLNEE